MYLSWAIYAEGKSDIDYFEALLPRILEDIILNYGNFPVDVPTNYAIRLGRNSREIDAVAREACDGRGAFELLFVHADTGGRGLAAGIENRSQAFIDRMADFCQLRADRAVIIAPCHETEAWVLADLEALLNVLGYRDPANRLRLPTDAGQAENLKDPKAVLEQAIDSIYRRRSTSKKNVNFGAIALRQNLNLLRGSNSYRAFEEGLRRALSTWNIIDPI